MKGQLVNDAIVSYGDFISGPNVYNIPDDYSPERYNYVTSTPGVFDPNGFILIPETTEIINFAKRQSNIQAMNIYMANLVNLGQLSQNNFDVFLSDTVALVQQYLGGNGRLITWIETVSRNGYNATTTGFKTKTAYRGILVGGVYPRAEAILSILNNL